jgi:hypothetical protein
MRFRQAGVALLCRPVTNLPQLQTHSRAVVTLRSRIASATARAMGTGTPLATARILADLLNP